MIITLPTSYFLVAGYAEGPTLLNAFDNALMKAGVGNTNLVRMSSILPPNCKRIEPTQLPYGALIPVAYAEESSPQPGTPVAAAVACGVPDDPRLPGVIMEHHMTDEEKLCREIVLQKLEAAFAARGYKLKDVQAASAFGIVKEVGSAFAGVVLWS
jgi:arginine decarboxylase